MSDFRIQIDRSLCSGFGSCVDASPKYFTLDGAGIATALAADTDDGSALDAAASCPMGAIAVFDAATGSQVA